MSGERVKAKKKSAKKAVAASTPCARDGTREVGGIHHRQCPLLCGRAARSDSPDNFAGRGKQHGEDDFFGRISGVVGNVVRSS